MRRAVVVVVLVALAAPAVASAGCPRTSVAALEDSVMCQVCGVPLGLATDSPEATSERAFISRLVSRCESTTQIKAALVAQYGPSVLALPPGHGFNLAAYLVPVVGVLLAASLVTLVVVRRRTRANPAPGERPSLAAADAARVEAALDRFES